MRLTPLGESLLDPAQHTLQRIDSLMATKPLFDPATAQRHFTITACDDVISAVVPAYMVSHEHPHRGVFEDSYRVVA